MNNILVLTVPVGLMIDARERADYGSHNPTALNTVMSVVADAPPESPDPKMHGTYRLVPSNDPDTFQPVLKIYLLPPTA